MRRVHLAKEMDFLRAADALHRQTCVAEARCWLQVEPARKLVRWKNIRVLDLSANGTYHRTYDPCIPKWLNQAGVKTDFVRLEAVGISGNSHMMMLEKNSDDVIKRLDSEER